MIINTFTDNFLLFQVININVLLHILKQQFVKYNFYLFAVLQFMYIILTSRFSGQWLYTYYIII